MKKAFLTIWLCCIASFIVVANDQIKRVAITEVVDSQSNVDPGLKLAVRSSLTTGINLVDNYEAYERVNVAAMFRELDFQRTGYISDDQIHKIGDMTGSSYILIPELARLFDDSKYVLTARIIDVVTGLVTESAETYIEKNLESVQNGARELAMKLLGVSPSKPVVQASSNRINGHEYVDLGLSVKWATCNVGASSPGDYGSYFAWGETRPKSNYDWNTYKYCNGSYVSMTKYCTQSDYGSVDNRTRLEMSDDAARANWGGSWRMPTYGELDELKNQCTWQWTTQNGHKGYKVTSKKNGNSIFLPAAGDRGGTSTGNVGFYGYYWSSSHSTSRSDGAYYLYFGSGEVDWSDDNRHFGQSVRAVSE